LAPDGSKSETHYRAKAQQNALFWKVVLSGAASYEAASKMDFDELREAAAAIDLFRAGKL